MRRLIVVVWVVVVVGALVAVRAQSHTPGCASVAECRRAVAWQHAKRVRDVAWQRSARVRAEREQARTIRALTAHSTTRYWTPAVNRAIGRAMAAEAGWTGPQWACLDRLIGHNESGWQLHDRNASSGADGIPQALPPSKMRSHGADYASNPSVQIAWMRTYIHGRYGSPCGALAHSRSTGWY